MSNETTKTDAKCPFHAHAGGGTSNRDWWPNQLRVDLLQQHSSKSDPMGEHFDYAKEFARLDYAALQKDLAALMTDSQSWWPSIDTTCDITFENLTLTRSDLRTKVIAKGAEEAKIEEAAAAAKAGCPISKVLKVDISLELSVQT